MAESAQLLNEGLEMDKNLTEYSKPTDNTITEGQFPCCVDGNDMLQRQTVKNMESENGDDETSKPKKKYRSEKQKERTRQYKKKIRKEKRKMKAEMKMEDVNTNADQLVVDNRPVEANNVVTGATGVDLLLPREIQSELASAQIEECSGYLTDTSGMNSRQSQIVESKDIENTEENTNIARKKKISERQKERVRQYKKKIRKERRQMKAEKKMEEINNTAGQIVADVRPLDANDVAETEPTGAEALIPSEPVSTQLIPADTIMIPADIAGSPTQESSDTDDDPIPDNSTTDNDDVFGILSLYVESGIHFEFDQMGIRDFGRFDIQFFFNGKSTILKVTKFSTCDDVIHMVLHKIGLPVTKVMLYAVFERTGSVERMLSGKTLVYKVWRSWGCEKKHFEFHIRSKESKLGIKSNLSNRSAESCIDELFLDQYNRKALTQERHTSYSGGKNVSFNLENDNVKDITTSSRQKQIVSSGKQIVLARYLYDLFTRSDKKKFKQTGTSRRQRADGSENEEFRYADGSATSGMTNISQHEKCSYLWNKYYATDSESESDDSFSDTLSEDNFNLYHEEAVTLDTAFLKNARGDSDSDEGIDVTSVTSVDLDRAFIGDFENKCFLNVSNEVNGLYKDDAASEESFNFKENEFEMNISDDRFVKELFGKAGKETVASEDDEMDSFMRSRLESF